MEVMKAQELRLQAEHARAELQLQAQGMKLQAQQQAFMMQQVA